MAATIRGALQGALALVACAICGPAFAQAAPPPVSAYARIPFIGDAAITPDGKHVAVLRAAPEQLAAEILDTATLSHVGSVFPSEGARLSAVSFMTDDRVLITSSITGSTQKVIRVTTPTPSYYTFSRTISSTLDGKAQVFLLNDAYMNAINVSITSKWPTLPNDTGAIQMTLYDTAPRTLTYFGKTSIDPVLTLSRVDLATGRSRIVVQGIPETVSFILNGKGVPVGRLDRDEKANDWTLNASDGADWRQITTYTDDDQDIYNSTLPDGRMVKRGDHSFERKVRPLVAIDAKTGGETILYTPAKYDFSNVVKDPRTKEIVGVWERDDFPTQKFFDAPLEAIRVKIATHFKVGYFEMRDWDRAQENVIIRAETSAGTPGYYLYSVSADSLKLLGLEYPDVPAAFVGDRVSLKYKARDGVSIPAHLTTPTGVARKGLPLVILLNSEPGERNDASFDPLASLIVSRGYGVLQMNTRGAGGLTREWEEAGDGQWAGVMQNDVTDGVAAMIKAGIADPKRICIVGIGPHGGYAALTGAALTPDLYACAVSLDGVSDLVSTVRYGETTYGEDRPTADRLKRLLGDPDKQAAAMKTASPINVVDGVRAPILLLSTKVNPTVPITQTEQLDKKLRTAGKNVRFVPLLDSENPAVNRTLYFTETEAFLAAHLK